jgi:NitT/TauT family transport system ATP-binding protein
MDLASLSATKEPSMSTSADDKVQIPLLEAKAVGQVYGSGASAHEAIKEISFAVEKGTLVAIVGPSGCGKTTLLRCLSGLLSPTRGEVCLHGEAVADVPSEMAIVFQDYRQSLFPWKTVKRNVLFPLARKPGTRKEKDDWALECLRAVGLEGSDARYPWQLSGGMQQRVAIARALAYRPEILLMDEPFASVDAQTRGDLEDLVLRLRVQFNTTIIFVTHDIDESVYLADQVLVLSSSPTTVLRCLDVDLPWPRDQISTRGHEAFIELRTEVAQLIRHPAAPAT